MSIRSCAWQTDVALLAATGSVIEEHDQHVVVRTPDNPTFYWGNFLLLRVVPTELEVVLWIELFERTFPDCGHLALGIDLPDGGVRDLSGFVTAGLTVEVSQVLTANEVAPPRAVRHTAEIRPLVSTSDWEALVDLSVRVNAAEDDPHPEDEYRIFSGRRARTDRALVESRRGAWFGAFADDAMVASLGVVAVDGDLARYQQVQTDPDHRSQGLAGTLLHAAGQHALTHLGATTLVIVADPDHHAIDLYRRVGFSDTEVQLQAQRRSL